MYSNLRGCARVNNNNVKQNFNGNIGTRQGDVTSTIIFHLYINELSNYLKSKGHRGILITEYISDTICILFSDYLESCVHTTIELQSQLNSI